MIKRVLAISVAVLALHSPARALTIDFNLISGDSLSNGQEAAFRTAAQAWSRALTDNVTVSLDIGFRSLGSRILGATSSTLLTTSAHTFAAALAKDATTTTDAAAVASLSNFGQGRVTVTSAEAKALNLQLPSMVTSDGSIEFSSDYRFSTSRSANGTIAAGTYDLIGIAEHEIGHALGFISALDFGDATPTALDLFRYASPGLRSFSIGAAAYFSIDGGRTALASFEDGTDDQASHWHSGTKSDSHYAVMNPEVGTGQPLNSTTLDIQALDAIGWNAASPTVSPVPLPASAPLFGAALLALAGLSYGRNRRAAKSAK